MSPHAVASLPRLGAALLAALVLGACATPPTPAPGEDVARAAELHDVPFHPQKLYQCGPAAVATMLGDLGIEADPDDLVSEVYVPEREGSLPAEMRASVRARGLVAYPLAPSIDDLVTAIDAGYPVLVMQNLGLDWAPTWHYAVVVGYDLERERVVLRSETDRRRVNRTATFQRTWARADYWAQLVVEPHDIPPVAEPLAWLEAVHELEERGDITAARAGYEAATREWPTYRPAWMARGNAAWAAGDVEAAADAFAEAVLLDAERWEGWNNLAHALARDGCGAPAAQAAYCAHQLAPDEDATRSTLAQFADAEGGDGCQALPPCPALRP